MSLAKQLQQLRRTQQGDSTRSSCRTRSGRSSLRPHTLVLIYCGSLLQAYLRTCSHLRVGQAAPQAGGTWRTRKASPPRLSDSVRSLGHVGASCSAYPIIYSVGLHDYPIILGLANSLLEGST